MAKRYSIVNADLLDWLRGRTGPKAHAVLCDPPYGLAFMNQKWDDMTPHEFQAWCTEWGELLLDHVHPGAMLMAFGGTRTYHRLAAGLEDAGWIISDSISWMYGSGFPKSHNIGKAIDRAAGAERNRSEWYDRYQDGGDRTEQPSVNHVKVSNPAHGNHRTLPATPDAARWDGYGTALKPAHENIVVARAPWRGTYAGIALQYGTGAINVDGGRIPSSGDVMRRANNVTIGGNGIYGGGVACETGAQDGRRWPANVILDAHAAAELDAMSGVSVSRTVHRDPNGSMGYHGGASGTPSGTMDGYNDEAGASRFFYTAKSPKWQREAGLHHRARQNVNDGRATSIDNAYQRGDTMRLNSHPTLKPIDLTRYLATLLLPPVLDAPRTLLVPFSGSGSEMIGALLAGWDRVIGCEQSAEYARIARDRLRWWVQFDSIEQAHAAYMADVGELAQRDAEAAHGFAQLALFDAAPTSAPRGAGGGDRV